MYSKTGTMVHTVSRSTDIPSSAFGLYSLLATPTTAQASIGVSDYCGIRQRIEGNMLRPFKGKKLAMSFWVKAYKTGVYCVAFRNADNTKSLIKEYTISASNTWEKKTIRFTHDTTGTWLYDTGIGMGVLFVVAAGTSLRNSADAWLSGNYIATSNQVNGVDNVLDTFQIADVCLIEDNEGQTREVNFTTAARDIFEELQLCQRYYEKSSDLGQIASHSSGLIQTYTNSNGAGFTFFTYKAVKRATPVVTSNGSISSTAVYSGLSQVCFQYSGASVTWYTNWFTADAEL